MRAKFFKYYKPTKDEFSDLWHRCTFIVDANVLLSVYRYSKNTREDLLKAIEQLPPRLWIPYQFALEYHENRITTLLSQIKSHSEVATQLKHILAQRFEPRYKNLAISPQYLTALKEIITELEYGRKEHERLLTDDPYQARIAKLFEGRVGEPPAEDELLNLHQEAKKRYQKEIPPGFADLKEKREPRAYGDYVAWTQIVGHAKSKKVPVILVTDDRKEDWWLTHSQWTIGPRMELIEEFRRECNEPFYMYPPDQFIRFAGEYLKQPVRDETITEIKEQARVHYVSEPTLKPETTSSEQYTLSVDDIILLEEAKASSEQAEATPKVPQHSEDSFWLKPAHPKAESGQKPTHPEGEFGLKPDTVSARKIETGIGASATTGKAWEETPKSSSAPEIKNEASESEPHKSDGDYNP